MLWKRVVLSLVCYLLVWPVIERVVWSSIVDTGIGALDPLRALFSAWFALGFALLHLPLFLLAIRLTILRSGYWLSATSAAMGALLAPAQYAAMVWQQGGYSADNPDPSHGWDPRLVWAFLAASMVTGFLLGLGWQARQRPEQTTLTRLGAD